MGTPIKMSDYDFDNKKLQPKEVEPLPVNYNVDSPFKAGVVPEVKPSTGAQAMNDAFGSSWLLSPEEVARRQKKATTAAMIGNLGNVMSAFSNLYYVNKGAPSQQVPKAVIPDYMTLQDRVTQARREALNDKYQRDKLQQQIDYQNESIALRKAQEQRLNESARLAWRKQDWLEKYQAGVLKIKEEQNRINEEYKKGQISIQEWRAANDELKAMAAMQNAGTNAARENRLAGGTAREEVDQFGNVKRITTTPQQVAPTNGSSQQGGKGKGYGTRNNGDKGRGY